MTKEGMVARPSGLEQRRKPSLRESGSGKPVDLLRLTKAEITITCCRTSGSTWINDDQAEICLRAERLAA